ncbi:unnamed protein product [Sympodiomycopsis kandeliae]
MPPMLLMPTHPILSLPNVFSESKLYSHFTITSTTSPHPAKSPPITHWPRVVRRHRAFFSATADSTFVSVTECVLLSHRNAIHYSSNCSVHYPFAK